MALGMVDRYAPVGYHDVSVFQSKTFSYFFAMVISTAQAHTTVYFNLLHVSSYCLGACLIEISQQLCTAHVHSIMHTRTLHVHIMRICMQSCACRLANFQLG